LTARRSLVCAAGARSRLRQRSAGGRKNASTGCQREEELNLTKKVALILVGTLGGPTMLARIGVMRALNRHDERVFDPTRKGHHWGGRKLARTAKLFLSRRCGGIVSAGCVTLLQMEPSAPFIR